MTQRRRLAWAGGTIGFALGGFIDGILLHQVLQWHHLLSLVPGAAFQDIRVQIMADGLFHVLMYVIALAGLWLLWRGRDGFTGVASDRWLLGSAALGFSLWQFTGDILFHWILAIHRTRLGVDSPLLWDLGWLAVWGLPSLAIGLWLLQGGDPTRNGGTRAAPALLSLAVLVAGPAAAMPAGGQGAAMVLFRPGLGAPAAFAAVAAADGRILWADSSGALMAVDLGTTGSAWRLYAHGALMVSTSPVVAGCLAAL